ncbi:hypothetical protein KP509_30G025600 [Ceratopteris richardii]|uniref:Uncharacterized protein n=1 Tax=Ceratopteris richardii TaxID=49495 RepID=A0A8T2R101_CERRI|nr:hypothetical protein KP509_30G025600 [Ceratopteris richardii]
MENLALPFVGVCLDISSLVLFQVCERSKDLQPCTRLHSYILRRGLIFRFSDNLISAYVRGGGLEKAQVLFRVHNGKDVSTWTSLITGCVQVGKSPEALSYFGRMQWAELLEELCNELGEAISRKELQVITSLTSTEVEVDEDKTMLNVRIVSPKGHNLARDLVAGSEKIGEQVTEGLNSDADSSKNLDSECSEVESGAISDARESNNQSFDTGKIMLSSKPETYPEFLFNVDTCLQQVEAQLQEFLNIAAMILPEDVDDGNGNPNRVAVVRDIWQDVHTTRQRIKDAIQNEGSGHRIASQ